MKKGAFTLVEILLAIAVIGFVSVLMLPTLQGASKHQVYVTQLRKVYSDVLQATSQVKTDSKSINLLESQLRRNGSSYLLTHYFKTSQVCTSPYTPCLASSYKNINNDAVAIGDLFNTGGTCAIIASGATICVSPMTANGSISVLTDVNSQGAPNTVGRDVFGFNISNDGTTVSVDARNLNACKGDTRGDGSHYCFAQIVNDGWKMDY